MENVYFYINFIHENLENNYLIFFIIYFISLVIFFSFSPPGGPIPLMASGFFFGFYVGFLINIFSILIGSYFFISFAKNIFIKFFNKWYIKISEKFYNFIKNSSYEYLILFRLTGNPLFIQNLCFSFLNISKKKFLISSFFGFSPGIIILTYFGSKLYEIYEIKNAKFSDIISKDFIFLILFVIMILILRIIFKTKKNNIN